ncbi:hypothetical protein DFS33DRAFT_1055579 [Desarmillaria ectypa]|nr:hypothetical protein DFS33DRAFT_1055579 [Desarmillaria ectypa]
MDPNSSGRKYFFRDQVFYPLDAILQANPRLTLIISIIIFFGPWILLIPLFIIQGAFFIVLTIIGFGVSGIVGGKHALNIPMPSLALTRIPQAHLLRCTKASATADTPLPPRFLLVYSQPARRIMDSLLATWCLCSSGC